MKKLFLILISALLLASVACNEIGMEESSEVDNSAADSVTESNNSESNASTVESNSAAESLGSDTVSDGSESEESESVSISEPSAPEFINDYAVELTDEELECINAGNDGSFLILVNKNNILPSDFEPENLVNIRDTRQGRNPEKMNATAETALHAFLKEAAYYGHGDVSVTSGYRTISLQNYWYNHYIEEEMSKGLDRASAEAAVSLYSAYPGTSEHHTGLCIDMHNLDKANQSFGATEAAKWLKENAHRFGFILRYPEGKTDITGYMWEPWHFRFVGRYHATEIYNSGLTLEEYLEK
ncbi:MAG: M15 family metallopeptidase [Clostridia bacterium]|nr:M15 family metallopeptidase [Clostridia bacterium]